MTVNELREQTGFGEGRVRRILGKMIGSGEVRCVRIHKLGIDGILHPAPVYQFVGEKHGDA